MLSHTTAAQVWGAPVDGTDPVHLTVTDRRRTIHVRGARIHVTTDLVDLRPVVRAGLRVTNPVRVLCDVGAADPTIVSTVLHHFFVTGVVPPDAAWTALDRHARRGRAGIGPLRAALDAYPLGHKPPDSVLEETFARLLRRHRLPPATFHAVLRGWEVDFHVDGTRVVIECDGWSSHGLDREQFERDRRKDAELRAAGYVVCRYSWLQITRQERWVAENLRQVLQQVGAIG
jgi:very-short-patch-repair endonuclease